MVSQSKLQAQLALEYTKGVITLGAENKWDDVFDSFGMSLFAHHVARTKNKITGGNDEGDKRVPRGIRLANNRAHDFNAGNCGEHAACAFMYLFNKGIHPIDLYTGLPSVDHQFVVIGRVTDSDDKKPETWGEEC